MAAYFYKTYNKKITDKRQPMIIIKTGGKEVAIPSEFCLTDGVPDSIKSNPMAMRTLLGKVRQDPTQKLTAIKGMMQKLFKMDKWKEWDIKIDEAPQSLGSRTLAVPQLVHNEGDDKKLFVNERLLKQMPVFSSSELQDFDLLFLHDQRSKNEAENTMKNLLQC